MAKAHSVEEYIEKHAHFKEALLILREILLKTELEETLKWQAPVYTIHGKNVIGIGAFKNHFGLWFFNGVYLKDTEKLLVKAQEKTKGLRQMRFEKEADINKHAVLAYIKEAIANQKAGKEITATRKGKTVKFPEELVVHLKENPTLKVAFMALTPGRQREYADYIESAKRDATKQTRLEKIKPLILEGKGLYDKYKDC